MKIVASIDSTEAMKHVQVSLHIAASADELAELRASLHSRSPYDYGSVKDSIVYKVDTAIKEALEKLSRRLEEEVEIG